MVDNYTFNRIYNYSIDKIIEIRQIKLFFFFFFRDFELIMPTFDNKYLLSN